MQAHWFFSQTFHDQVDQILKPVCSAYGGHYSIPLHPATEDGWTLVQMLSTPMQMQAAALDARVLVLPFLFDHAATLPEEVVKHYATEGATADMTLGALLGLLAKTEPRFAEPLQLT